jgi:hypothetical protein
MKRLLALATFAAAISAASCAAVAGSDASGSSASVRTVHAGFNDAIPFKTTARFGDADVPVSASTYVEIPELTHKIQCKAAVSKCYLYVEAYFQAQISNSATIGIFIDDVQVDSGPFIAGNETYYQGISHVGAAAVTPGVSHTVKIKAYVMTATTSLRGAVRTSSYYK